MVYGSTCFSAEPESLRARYTNRSAGQRSLDSLPEPQQSPPRSATAAAAREAAEKLGLQRQGSPPSPPARVPRSTYAQLPLRDRSMTPDRCSFQGVETPREQDVTGAPESTLA